MFVIKVEEVIYSFFSDKACIPGNQIMDLNYESSGNLSIICYCLGSTIST